MEVNKREAVKIRNGGTVRARKGRTMSREATRVSVEEKKATESGGIA